MIGRISTRLATVHCAHGPAVWIRLSIFRMFMISSQNYAGSKKSYRNHNKTFATLERAKPNTENVRRLTLASIKPTSIQVTALHSSKSKIRYDKQIRKKIQPETFVCLGHDAASLGNSSRHFASNTVSLNARNRGTVTWRIAEEQKSQLHRCEYLRTRTVLPAAQGLEWQTSCKYCIFYVTLRNE